MATRAVVMIVDGLRADLVDPERTPSLWALRERGRWFDAHRSVFPSATRVNSASIATGCRPAAHGLAGNTIALDEGEGLRPVSVGSADFRERWRRATGHTLLRPTLAERLRDAGGAVIHSNSSPGAAHMQDPDGHGTLLHRSGSHRPGLRPLTGDRHPQATYDAAGDALVTARFLDTLAGDPPAALDLLWICEPDHSQHALELGSPEHHAVLAEADRRVGEVTAAVERLRRRGDDVLLVASSDHGHETTEAVVPVVERLVADGLKASPESTEVVVGSSGMGALVWFDRATRHRAGEVARWLRAQPWCGPVHQGEALEALGVPRRDGLEVAFGMAKRDEPNRFGIPGLGHVAADTLGT